MAEDPVFARDGADIYVESNISFTQVRTKYILVVSLTQMALRPFQYFPMFYHLIKEGKNLNILDVLHTKGEHRAHTFLLLGLVSNSAARLRDTKTY